MARRWTHSEEDSYRRELVRLYEKENKTIGEISSLLGIAEQTAFQRLQRLGIQTHPQRKSGYRNSNVKVRIPGARTVYVAEFLGVMLGDGHISHFQTVVTLGSKEPEYAEYIRSLMEKLFHVRPKIGIRATGHRDVYLGSVAVTKWLLSQGLVQHKVKRQVDVPEWIFNSRKNMEAFVRGFFDTDGSVYKLKYGIQVSFCNESEPLLRSLQSMLAALGYDPSAVSSSKVCVTKVPQVQRFFREIRPANAKHLRRYEQFIERVGIEVVKRDAL